MLAFVLIIIAAINILLGAMVFSRRHRHPLHQSFLLLTIGVGAWSFMIGMYYLTDSLQLATFYAHGYYAAALLITASLFTFAFSLKSNDATIKPMFFATLSIPFLYIFVAIIAPEFLFHIDQLPNTITFKLIPYILYSIIFCGLFVIASVKLVQVAYSEPARRRKQLSVVCVGVFIAGIIGICFNLILPAFGIYSLIAIGPAFSLLFLISTSYAVVRYRLFDLRLALARAFAYLISLSWVIIVYALALSLIGLTLFNQSNISTYQHLVYLGLAILLTLTFQPIKRFFDKFTRYLFFKQPLDPEKVIGQFNDLILSEVEFKPLSQGIFKIIDETFKPVKTVLWITQGRGDRGEALMHPTQSMEAAPLARLIKRLDSIKTFSIIDIDYPEGAQETQVVSELETLGLDLILRIQTTQRQLGYLLVGHRQSGGTYGTADRYVLMTAADELALAIENSIQFEQIREFNLTLQAKVNEATSELRQSNRKLHTLDESKDEFISMASHQLRTPLTTVKGYLSMLLDGDVGKLTAQQRGVLEEAYSSSQRMVYLISDFLNVSRLQTGKFELEIHEVDIAAVVEQEVRQMQDSARSRHMTLEYHKPDRKVAISLDENKIRQVIMNLIDNAIYYSQPGGTIRVTLTKQQDYASLRVIDHGIGVPANERHNLFSKFYRASNARRQRPDGTGIGLFMARKVIAAHGGTIIFETVEGKGSTFGFRLPLNLRD